MHWCWERAAIRQGLTLNFNWVRRDDYQQEQILNLAVPSSAWTPLTITNPLDGTPITMYNLDPSFVGRTSVLYQTNAPRSLRRNSYNGFETSVTGRLPRGAFVFAGWTIDRVVDTSCDAGGSTGATATGAGVVLSGSTPGGLTNNVNDPNQFRFCDQLIFQRYIVRNSRRPGKHFVSLVYHLVTSLPHIGQHRIGRGTVGL